MAPERRRHLETAAAVYKRALALPADEVVKGAILERLLVVFDDTGLNDPSEMVRALEALIALQPTRVEPLLRYASYQERQRSLDAAEETLLSARRLRVGDGLAAPRRFGNLPTPPTRWP